MKTFLHFSLQSKGKYALQVKQTDLILHAAFNLLSKKKILIFTKKEDSCQKEIGKRHELDATLER
jgi:hypothetical protein